ncbi:MAG: LacI family transcriptional regulator [Bryobacteraceae bacterium]|nr:LacI family transcriptional regulator [Bryobacteraceae bacterium]
MPTIRDVAARAQVSVATVSRVLNDSGYADSQTRARVLRAAADLNYQPNANWSRLKRQSSQTILFLLGNWPGIVMMHMRLLAACERILRGQGYDLVFARYDYARDSAPGDLTLPRMLAQSGAVDGVVLAGVHHENFLHLLDQRPLPYTMLGNSFSGPAAAQAHNCILYDDIGACAEAVAYLRRLGHRRIAFVGNVALPWFGRRYEGYRQAMQEAGLEPISVGDNWPMSGLDYGQLATAQLLRDGLAPTAILAGNDEIAAGLWRELSRRRYHLPHDMSLIGIGNRPEFGVLDPALTSISVFEDQLGERLASLLLERIRHPESAHASETYPCKLIERASCAPPSTPMPNALTIAARKKTP